MSATFGTNHNSGTGTGTRTSPQLSSASEVMTCSEFARQMLGFQPDEKQRQILDSAASQGLLNCCRPDGRILIPGFYDKVVPPSEKEREAWASLPFDESEYLDKEMGAKALVVEPGVPLFERLWARPTFEVHGIRGGLTAKVPKR